MTNSNNATITADQSAAKYAAVQDPQTKWDFLDSVVQLIALNPQKTQRQVIDLIGETATFIALHGHHRDTADGGKAAKPAKSRLKSIRDEVSVVKVWGPADRVDGVSFEAHKVLNRLGADAGKKILTALVKEMGGPANVTKNAVSKRLKVADPDHVPQSNGKTPAAGSTTASGNQAVTRDMTPLEMAHELAVVLTVGELGKDASLAKAVEKVADIFEAFSQRKANKAKAAKKKAPAKKAAAKKAPVKKPAVKRPAVKRPVVKAPAK